MPQQRLKARVGSEGRIDRARRPNSQQLLEQPLGVGFASRSAIGFAKRSHHWCILRISHHASLQGLNPFLVIASELVNPSHLCLDNQRERAQLLGNADFLEGFGCPPLVNQETRMPDANRCVARLEFDGAMKLSIRQNQGGFRRKVFGRNTSLVTSPIEVSVGEILAEVINQIGYPGTRDTYRVDVRMPSGSSPGPATVQLRAAWISGTEFRLPVQ